MRRINTHSPKTEWRFHELDGVRGIAVLMVLFYHYLFIPFQNLSWRFPANLLVKSNQGGWTGVHLFFILSGFLITRILLHSKSSPSYFQRFYLKRVLRIFPAYFFAIFLLVLFGFSQNYLTLSALFLSNFAPYFGIPMEYPAFWTLSVEEHFYLVWPFLVFHLSPKQLSVVCWIGILLGPLLRAYCHLTGITMGYETWFSMESLCFGTFIALKFEACKGQSRSLNRLGVRFLLASMILFLSTIWFGLVSRQSFVGTTFQLVFLDLLFSGLFLLVLGFRSTQWTAWLLHPSLKFFGKISFSLYLLHPLALMIWEQHRLFFDATVPFDAGTWPYAIYRTVLLTLASTAISYFSYLVIESPAQKAKTRLVPA